MEHFSVRLVSAPLPEAAETETVVFECIVNDSLRNHFAANGRTTEPFGYFAQIKNRLGEGNNYVLGLPKSNVYANYAAIALPLILSMTRLMPSHRVTSVNTSTMLP